MEGDCQVEHGPAAIYIPGFYILRYPVTNGQYMRFVRETGYSSPDGTNFLAQLSQGLTAENEDLPVTFVSPEDASAYAALFLARDDSHFVNGTIITCDSGWTCFQGSSD